MRYNNGLAAPANLLSVLTCQCVDLSLVEAQLTDVRLRGDSGKTRGAAHTYMGSVHCKCGACLHVCVYVDVNMGVCEYVYVKTIVCEYVYANIDNVCVC